MPQTTKSFSVFEFVKKFEGYMKPNLRQYPIDKDERYALNRYINFNTHRVTLALSKQRKNGDREPVATFLFQNLRPNGEGSSFKGSIEHASDGRRYDFLYLVDTPVQLSTLSYELTKYFDALMTGQPLPEEVDEMLSGSDDSVHPTTDEGVSEEDIENMSEEEIQAMMEQEVARTLNSKGEDTHNPQENIHALLSEADEDDGQTELSVDDIQNLIMGGGNETPKDVDASDKSAEDTANLAADSKDEKASELKSSPESAQTDDAENLTAEEIHKMVMNTQQTESQA